MKILHFPKYMNIFKDVDINTFIYKRQYQKVDKTYKKQNDDILVHMNECSIEEKHQGRNGRSKKQDLTILLFKHCGSVLIPFIHYVQLAVKFLVLSETCIHLFRSLSFMATTIIKKQHRHMKENFLRQFREEHGNELKRLTAVQFMEVWNHYDIDGINRSSAKDFIRICLYIYLFR